MLDTLNDEEIWSLCLDGDRNAFKIIYSRYYYPLFYYGRKFCTDSELLKDCLQSFFLKLITHYQTLSDTPSVRCYLYKAFRNSLYNALKSEFVRCENITFCPDDALLSYEVEAKKSQEIILDSVNEEDVIRVRKALKAISSRQQEILYLYYVKGLDHSEISEVLNINYQSSKNLLSRTVIKLRDLLSGDN
jgi:RNA polymerase sigma-70 factor (ECF subfamily)